MTDYYDHVHCTRLPSLHATCVVHRLLHESFYFKYRTLIYKKLIPVFDYFHYLIMLMRITVIVRQVHRCQSCPIDSTTTVKWSESGSATSDKPSKTPSRSSELKNDVGLRGVVVPLRSIRKPRRCQGRMQDYWGGFVQLVFSLLGYGIELCYFH